ncbi:ABC transporter permease [Geofilum rhodophaeum]|uniref:ABC transporter permease n=1 Tax=Geofilum rhodophaeum TaxID=1965019 RepID=UPI000B52618F|nr:ABC transporter permease [Geofilum rhodophaeum]
MTANKEQGGAHRPLLRVLYRELDRIGRHRVYWFLSILGPLLAFLLVMNIFAAGVPSNLPVAVVNQDQTALSRQLVRMLDASRIAQTESKWSDLHQAREALLRGEVAAILYLPKGFEQAVLKGEGSTLDLMVNNTNVLKGGLLQSGIHRVVSTLSTGIKLQVATKKGLAPELAYGQVYAVGLDAHVLFNPYTNYAWFLVTALLPLLVVVFTLLGAIYAIGMEIREGTGREWLSAAGDSMLVALTGKLLPHFLLMLINVAVMHFILARHLGFPLRGYWGAIMLAQVLLLLAYQMVGVLLVALTANARLSLSLGSAYAMLAFTYSGLTFPVMGMPLAARVLAALFPYYHWMKVFIGQALRAEPLRTTVLPLSGLLVFVGLGLLCMPRLKRVLLSERFRHRC